MSRSWFSEHNLDPALAEMAEAVSGEHLLEGILRLEDPDQIPPHFSVVSRFDRISTGRFPAARTWEIRRHPNVVSLKAARPLGIHEGDGDIFNLQYSRETAEQAGSLAPFTGRGCLVAALDFGLDFAHPNFVNPDGTTRLVSFWHQGATYDPARSNRFGYGRIYSREEINAALRASDPYQALGYHPAISDTGKGSHGTHTLDIAAGNGRAPGARPGVARDAELVFVNLSTPRLGLVGDLGDSVRLLEALDFVDKTAHGVPWVANLSLGRTAGSHDGTSLVEQGMHELLRSGPGRAIAQSAGNYRSADLAVEGWLRDGEQRDLDWIIDPRDTTANELDVWYSGKDRLLVAIRAPQETALVQVRLGDAAEIVHQGLTVGRIYHRKNDPNNRDNHVEVFLYAGAPPGIWTVRLIGDYVISGRFHAWIERDLARPGAQSRFDPRITSQRYTLGTIATSPLVITVGAYDANAEARPLAHFSSCGPTRDERRDKPELLAPGVEVVAARSTPRDAVRPEGLLVARSGTSMAAPHVTGTIAAMFEAAGRPVSINEIRNCLERSAEPVTDDRQHGCCAWGRLNSAEAIRRIRDLTGEKLVSARRANGFVSERPVIAPEPAISDAATGDFRGTSEEQETEVSLHEGAAMNIASEDRLLSYAERALRMANGGRRQSESAFLRQLLDELGSDLSAYGLSPARLFRTVVYNRALIPGVEEALEVVAMPGMRPKGDFLPGDWMLRAVPGTGDAGHIAVLASGDLRTPAALASEGIAAESARPGRYGLVIEPGVFPPNRSRRFARRLLDRRGRAPLHTLVLRPRYSRVVSDFPPDEPEPSSMPSNLVEQAGGSSKTFIPEDLAPDMVGLEMVLASTLKTSDGRSFAVGSTVLITAWDNAKEAIEGTIGGSAVSIPKEFLAPKAKMYKATYTSRSTQRDVAIPLYVTDAASLRATIADGKAKGKDQSNNYKQLNKHLLIEMQLNRFDHYLGGYVGHYDALIGEPNGWAPLAPGWVKSMMVQESTAGSAGVYLVEVPGVPMKTRFNVLQAIDSWGPQQFLMIQEMEPESLKKSGFGKVMDDQRRLEEEWQRLDAMKKRNRAQQQRLDELDRLKFADVASRTGPTWSTFFFEYPNVLMKPGAKKSTTPAATYWDFVVKFLSAGSPPRKDDYRFWIQTGIRWLFEKRKATANWSDAVRAYNGTGGRAEFYRAIVLTRARAAAAAAGINEPIWGGLYCRPGTKTVDGKFNLCAFERVANPCEPRC